jgi:hypothetical protein
MFENLEKIEKELLSPCRYLTLKNVVSLGRASNRDKSKLDAVYAREYNSNKYSNHGKLKAINMTTSDFLVFSYSRDRDFSEIYVSYPHLPKIVKAFRTMNRALKEVELFVENKEDNMIYINKEFEEFEVRVTNLSSGKSILMVPDIIDVGDGQEAAGVSMYIGEETNHVGIDFESFDYLANFIETFNLNLSSQLLTNSAMMYTIYNGGGMQGQGGSGSGALDTSNVVQTGRRSRKATQSSPSVRSEERREETAPVDQRKAERKPRISRVKNTEPEEIADKDFATDDRITPHNLFDDFEPMDDSQIPFSEEYQEPEGKEEVSESTDQPEAEEDEEVAAPKISLEDIMKEQSKHKLFED